VHTAIGVAVSTPGRAVFDLARSVERWPELLPHYRSVHVLRTRDGRMLAQMVAVRPFGPLPVPVTWRAVCWADESDPDDLRLEFRHVRGVTRGMIVTWHIQPTDPDGRRCQVRIMHEFRRQVPVLGPEALPAFVDRLFTRPIASRTLAAFKRLAEAAHPPDGIATKADS
jgi:ribosome-associated toxin RatA of RatAB toxin-antitoxin module